MAHIAFQLTPEERSHMDAALHHTHHAGAWCRMRALLLLAQGYRVTDVAAALWVHRQAIHKWRTLYEMYSQAASGTALRNRSIVSMGRLPWLR